MYTIGITISAKNSDLDLKRQNEKNACNLLLRRFSCSFNVKCYFYGGIAVKNVFSILMNYYK